MSQIFEAFSEYLNFNYRPRIYQFQKLICPIVLHRLAEVASLVYYAAGIFGHWLNTFCSPPNRFHACVLWIDFCNNFKHTPPCIVLQSAILNLKLSVSRIPWDFSNCSARKKKIGITFDLFMTL